MEHKDDLELILSKLDVEPNLDRINKKCNIKPHELVRVPKTYTFRPLYISLIVIIALLITLNIAVISIYYNNKKGDEPSNEIIDNTNQDENILPGDEDIIQGVEQVPTQELLIEYNVKNELFNYSKPSDKFNNDFDNEYSSNNTNKTLIIEKITMNKEGEVISTETSEEKVVIVSMNAVGEFRVTLENGVILDYNLVEDTWEEVK